MDVAARAQTIRTSGVDQNLQAAVTPVSLAPFLGVWQVDERGPPQRPSGAGAEGRGGGDDRGPGRNGRGRGSRENTRSDGTHDGRPSPAGDGPRGGPPNQPTEPSGLGLSAEAEAQLDMGDHHVLRLMTPEGRAAFAKFDPLQLPANNCISPGLPSIAMTPDLQDWSLEGGVLKIHHDYFDTVRKITLGGAPSAATTLTRTGVAFARMDAGRLMIETTNAMGAWSGLGRNAPSSDARKVTETYWVVAGGKMQGEIRIEDPKYLTQPLRMDVRLHRAAPGETVDSFPCDVAASRRHLK